MSDRIVEAPTGPPVSRGRAVLQAARPAQWLKNLLVFAAPAAAGALNDPATLWRTTVLLVAFSLVASGTYIWNDIHDRDADRAHPTKRHRPVAAGHLPVDRARPIGTGLLIAGVALAAMLADPAVTALVILYAVLTLTYTVALKHVAVVDLATIASGFVIRAAAGAVAARVDMSGWFVLFVVFGSLFVVTGKRFAELHTLGDAVAVTRSHLRDVPVSFLRDATAIACGGTILTYCVWALEVRGGAPAPAYLYEATVLPVVVALFRYLLMLHRGQGSAPEELFLRDRVLQVCAAVWLVIFIAAVQMS